MATCPDAVLRLIDKFHQQTDTLTSTDYNETQLRVDYINPFFRELGWDLDNTQGFAEQYREVVHEDRVKVAGQTKAPDYSFRIGGHRKFFLEAKKPAVDIRANWEPAYQLRRYAWSAKLACSLLTDFEEFAIYDTRIRPRQLEKASVARREIIAYTDYPARWDFIDGTFSKAAVLRGEFDRYCDAKKGRGAEPFDDAFLSEIEDWRTALATNLASRNPTLDQPALNFAVQRIIDRILFLRIAEDRGTETPGQLQALLNGDHAYERLCKLFRDADARYNSGLFHFQKERERDEAPDTLTPSLEVADKTLKDIVKALYYPQSPYEFTVVSADILGSVYERFLGKVITLTSAHRAKVEDKPEVRKAGGVYYTPAYIVEYIVSQTVGKLLEGKSPKDAARIRVLDPACGSGSFLIGAYDYLLGWYLGQYTAADPASLATGAKPILRQSPSGGWALTIAERKRILLDHIHGVDLDAQAVEVTKLNLLLKCLEGETGESLGFMRGLFKERALPDLGKNILCGNSLIGTDIIGTDAWNDMSEEERARVNPFDYERAFPHVFKGKTPGFDAVIGNPPYGAFASESEAIVLRERYSTVANSLDTFIMFVENAATQLRVGGIAGMIIPSGWVSSPSSEALRRFFLRNFVPRVFVSLPFGVFKDAYIDCVVFAAERQAERTPDVASVKLVAFPQRHKITHQDDFARFTRDGSTASWIASINQEFLVTTDHDAERTLAKIRKCKHTLGDLVRVKRGIETFRLSPTPNGMKAPRRAFDGVLQRFTLTHGHRRYLEYSPDIEAQKPWEFFSQLRILLRQVLSRRLRLQATLVSEEFLTNQSVQSLLPNEGVDPRWLLAIINSRLISWYFVSANATARRDDFPKIVIRQTRELPFPEPHGQHAMLTPLVDTILSLHKRLADEKIPQRREQLQREIDATDRQIDAVVYQLYGLTDDEIKIVEDATRRE